jgi:hypothetical protein
MAQPNYNLLNTSIPAEAASSATKGMQQVNLLRTQDLENRAAQMAIDNALAEQTAYRRSGSLQEAQQNLLRGGLGKQAAALGQSIATQGKTLAETQKVGYEVDAKKMDIMRERTKDLLGNTSDENYIAHVQEGIRDGLITPEQAQRSVQTYLAIPPNQRVPYLTQQLARAEKIFEANTITAAQQQSADLTRRGQDISAATQRRGQDIGRIPVGFRMTADGALEPIPGGPTTTNLSPKEIQAREAKFPQATSAVKTFEAKTDELEKDLIALRDHKGLASITGIAAGRAPGITPQGRAAEALYDKITARGGFKELQDMRAASPTGGALGNVSNQEGAQLRAAFAAIDRKQDAADVKEAIKTAISDLQASKGRVREAYNMTYDYKGLTDSNTPPPPPPPAPGAGGNSVTIPGGKVITFPTPQAAAEYKKAAGIKD